MNDSEERTIRHLTDALKELSGELCGLRAAVTGGLVTRCDLNSMEVRLMAGWRPSAEDQAILDALLARAGRVARKLEDLDTKTPPAQ